MYKNLIEAAREEGIKEVSIDALVCKEDGKVLLVEDLQSVNPFYHFPCVRVKNEETIPQAIQRAVTEITAMEIKEVLRYLGHYDVGLRRHLNFVVEVNDPFAVEENKSISFAWLDVQEAVGYPIQDEVREMLDLYSKA